MKEKEFSTSFVVMPRDANHYGYVHGGVMMMAADNLAYTIATRYSRHNVVTASVNRIDFKNPVKVGDLVLLDGHITNVGNSSMQISIDIIGEKLREGTKFDVASATMTMVAVDDEGKPVSVKKLRG